VGFDLSAEFARDYLVKRPKFVYRHRLQVTTLRGRLGLCSLQYAPPRRLALSHGGQSVNDSVQPNDIELGSFKTIPPSLFLREMLLVHQDARLL
jgi:hypothetical protein